jgi:lipoprotein-anchoring transpeptidase ErfK/SrfK
MPELSRRAVVAGFSTTAALGLAGCSTTRPPGPQVEATLVAPPSPHPDADKGGDPDPGLDADQELDADQKLDYAALYGPVEGDPFPIPAVNLSQIKPAFLRKAVDYASSEAPGTIVVDPSHHYLFHILENGRAMRYGVGVGREGFGWSGTAMIHSKQEWPDWYPPKEMFERQPEIKKLMANLQSGLGMHGGPGNPLGARAMYLWQGNVDTLYRIHGTVEPWTIGTSVSSGCIRMINQDAIDLYSKTPVGTKVVVLSAADVANATPATTL